MISAAVVAHSPLIRAGLKAALEEGGVRVTTSAETLAELAAAVDVNCEVIVADAPPEPALKEQLALAQAPALVVLVDLDEVDARTWLARGVSVLPRSADGPTINAAIAAAVAGLVAAPLGLIEDALRPGSLLSAGELYAELTAREIEVLARLASGADNRAIAEALHISPHTAKFHVGQILAKLGASSRTDAVAKAFRARLVASDP